MKTSIPLQVIFSLLIRVLGVCGLGLFIIMLYRAFTPLNCSFPGANEYSEFAKIPKVEREKRNVKFKTFNLKTQIDVYLCAVKCRNPSDNSVRGYLVNDGEAKILGIAKELNHSDDDLDKLLLLEVLFEIDLDCNCVSSNKTVMKILELNQGRIHNSYNEETAYFYSSILESIEKRSSVTR